MSMEILLQLSSAFVIGLMGSSHCVSMCGGIACALQYAVKSQPQAYLFNLLYSGGRIVSYGIAGLVTGFLGSLFYASSLGLILRSASGLLLIIMGLYITRWWLGLRHIEHVGQMLWKHLSPLTQKLLPVSHTWQALLLGALWGWLPCGLVYTTLIWSSTLNSALESALAMSMFGLGTTPAVLFTGLMAGKVRALLQKKTFRWISGCLIIAFGIWTLTSAWHHQQHQHHAHPTQHTPH